MKSAQQTGSVFGGMLLVAGSCVGAGMLALPILTGLSGFFPSLWMLILSWAFMTFTGLVLVEVHGWSSFHHKEVNLVSMAEEAVGRKGRFVAWVSYLFLFYSLLVAYTAASGSVFSAILDSLFSVQLAPPLASLFFTLLFGYIVFLGTRPVDLFNRLLMAGLILCYLGMIGLGLSRIDPGLLTYFAPEHALLALPVLVVSFGFQNMIPSLTAYLNGDLKRVRRTILGGSLITLAIYLIWSTLILGIVLPEAIQESYAQGEEATISLKRSLGTTWVSSFAQGFAFFAIVTSFLAQGLTLTHFLADGLKKAKTAANLSWLTSLALAPPLFLALYNPQVFFRALSFAGGVCAMILFGLLPVAMAWVGRYRRKHASAYHAPGGKITLVLAFLFSLVVIYCELKRFF